MLLAFLIGNKLWWREDTSLGLIGSLFLGKKASSKHLARSKPRYKAGGLCVSSSLHKAVWSVGSFGACLAM